MKNLSILICSVFLMSLGITACSKDGSKKQPNFRKRNQPFSKTQAGQRGEVTSPHKPVSGVPGDDNQAADPLTAPATTNKDLIVCDLLTDADQTSDNPCDAIRVANIDGNVGALRHQTGVYNQWKPERLVIETEDENKIIAKFSSKQVKQARKLKVLQIMKNDEEVSVPDEMKFQEKAHKSNENLDNVQDLFANIQLKPDEHLLVVTNIQALMDFPDQDNGSNVQLEKDFLKKNEKIQLDLTFTDASKMDEAIASEQAFLDSYVAQLSFTLQMKETDGMNKPVVTVNGEELLHDHFTWKANTSTNLVEIRATRMDVFNSPQYEVVVEIAK